MNIKKFYKFSYSAGTVFLVLSMLMSFLPAFTASAEPVTKDPFAVGAGNCIPEAEQDFKDEGSVELGGSYTAPEGFIIEKVGVKAATDCYVFGSNGTQSEPGSPECTYTVSGIGTSTVTISRATAAGCHDISHIELVYGEDTTPPPPPVLDVAVSKSADPTTVTAPGATVTFTVQVTNLSEVAMEVTDLDDDIFDDLDGQGSCATGAVLDPNETYTCSFTGPVNGNAGGTHTNIVTGTISGSSGSASDTGSATVDIVFGPPDPEDLSVLVQKSADPTEIEAPSGLVTFTVQVTNQSDVDATLTSLTDDIFGDLNGKDTCATGGTILAGETYSCSFSGNVTGKAGDTHTNIVSATITNGEDSDSDSDSADVDLIAPPPPPELSIVVTKSANPNTMLEPGGNATFTVDVENTSEVSLTITSIIDSVFGDLNGSGDCAEGAVIGAGETHSCSFIGSVSGTSESPHENTVTVVAKDDSDNTASDNDNATITFYTEGSEVYLIDPCTVGCDLENVTGQLCNGNLQEDYVGTIEWQAFVDGNPLGGGTIEGVPAGECVALVTPVGGEGLYSVVATLVDEDNRTINTECGPLLCQDNPPPPGPPPGPPTLVNDPPAVFIPVTGMDFGSVGLIQMLQNLGFAFLSLGLVVQGVSLRERRKRA